MSTEEKALPPIFTVRFEGQDVPAEDVDFEVEKEGWSIYQLSDGTRIKMKQIAARIVRLVDRYKDDGEPIYLLMGSPVISSIVPDQLKRKPASAE